MIVKDEATVKQVAEERIDPVTMTVSDPPPPIVIEKDKADPRTANPEAEEKAWKTYLKTGSLKEASIQAGVKLDTVKSWMKRRGWKALRGAELAKKGK